MRTNKARLTEWLMDMLAEHDDDDSDIPYLEKVESYRDEAEQWAGYIMEDVNMGIIAPDES